MRTSNEIVEILETYLKEKKISLRQFSILVDTPRSTILTWKKNNTLPSIDFMSKIASFMNVSLDWLINGEISVDENNTEQNPYSRKSILERIRITLMYIENSGYHEFEFFHEKYLKDIVDYELLNNWVLGRANMPEDVLPKIADKLDVSLQWLLTRDEYHQEDFNAHLYGLAIKYPGILKGFNGLDEEDKKFVDHYITTRLELRQLKREAELNKKNTQ